MSSTTRTRYVITDWIDYCDLLEAPSPRQAVRTWIQLQDISDMPVGYYQAPGVILAVIPEERGGARHHYVVEVDLEDQSVSTMEVRGP